MIIRLLNQFSNFKKRSHESMNHSIFIQLVVLFVLFITNVNCLEKSEFIISLILSMSNLIEYKNNLVCGEFISDKLENAKSGKFSFDNSLVNRNDSILCLYKFVANKNEKVVVKFDKFDIKSLAPE